MENLYETAGISRQAHYKKKVVREKKLSYNDELISQVKRARITHPRMGSRPMYHLLGVKGMGINQFERLLQRAGLGIKRKKNYSKTTDGYKFRGKSINLLNGKVVNNINQVWVSDITYFKVNSKNFYIIIIMDIYSRKILGCQVFENMLSENNVSVLKEALKSRGIEDYDEELIHHSDRGSQYLSTDYMKLLSRAKIKLSLAENSLQNGYAERINGIIKNDYLVSYATENLTMLRKYLRYCVDLYNNERPHSSLEYLTPTAFERSLKNKAGESMKLYDFNQKVSYEFLEASDIQDEIEKKQVQPVKEKVNKLNSNK